MEAINYSTLVFLLDLQQKPIAVACAFEKDKNEYNKATRYTYKTFDRTIKPGDFVVVESKSRLGLCVVEVKEVNVALDIQDQTEIKWIRAKVDTSQYEAAKNWEDQVITKSKNAQAQKKAAEFKKMIEESINGALDEVKKLPVFDAPAS